MTDDIRLLVVTGGHPYDEDAFVDMFKSMAGIHATFLPHPQAREALQPTRIGAYDTVFFYDMCGIPGAGLTHDGADDRGMPPADYARAIEALLESGTGLILANHATVSWPNWPLWRQITGSSFMLKAGLLNGIQTPGSGYRGGHGPLANATLRLTPEASHPVLAGLESGFEITDELYLKTSGFESHVLPLIRGEFEFTADHFSPPPLASQEEQADWDHPPGSNLLVWANACGRSPIVVSDLGDSPAAYGNLGFRRLIENALHWVATEEARKWAESFAN